MSGQPSGKTCVICGQDCAGRPRTKDAKGHYYHQDCYDAARRARAAHDAASSKTDAAPAAAHAAPEEEPDPFGLLNEVIDQSIPSAPGADAGAGAGVSAGHLCPACAVTLAPGSVICTNCGLNIQTGQAVGAAVMATPVKAKGGAEGTVWPVVIGIVSIIFGSCAALIYMFSLISSLGQLSGQSAGYITGRIAAPMLMMSLGLWLLSSGIGILRRRPEAAVQIRRWAIVKALLCVTCFGFSSLIVLGSGASLERMEERMGGELSGGIGDVSVGVIIMILAVVFGWFLFWPIFTFTWFGRAKIRSQIDSW